MKNDDEKRGLGKPLAVWAASTAALLETRFLQCVISLASVRENSYLVDQFPGLQSAGNDMHDILGERRFFRQLV